MDKIETLFGILDELKAYKNANDEALYELDNIEAAVWINFCGKPVATAIKTSRSRMEKNNENNNNRLIGIEKQLHEILKDEHDTEQDYEDAIGVNDMAEVLRNADKLM